MRSPFEKIKLSQLHMLCNKIAESRIRQVDYIKEKYSEDALWFDETLELLKDLKIVRGNSDELIPSKNFFSFCGSSEDYKRKFLPILFSADGNVSQKLREFLANFQIEKDKIIFNATPSEKIKFSDTRNLLLELEFIISSDDNNSYFVNSLYTELFFQKINQRKISPSAFKKIQSDKDEIGLMAEDAVIEFEIARLTDIPIEKSEIEHTSQKNVLAGYDIKSFENHLDENSSRIERYIEVKAVSVQDYKFFWSKNEIEIAKIFGEKYFLYLLPVISRITFDFENLLIIANPFKNIYSNQLEWKKEEESVSFSRTINK